jgi:hypothetical protein
MSNLNAIWEPQPQQAIFMARPEWECLYGGAAGGGKSDALLVEALRQIHIPHYRGLIFRRTYPQLEALIARSLEIYRRAVPGSVYNYSQSRWTFPSGAKIFFGYMQHDKDRHNWQGKPYDFIAFDELTHFTETQYTYLMSRNRPTGPGTRVYMRATANPGGIGHGWVKARFITPAPPMTPIETDLSVTSPDGEVISLKRSRIFVPATVFDNKILLRNDPNYLAALSSMPEAEVNALLYGDWDSFSGQVFTEWRNDPEHYQDRKWTHVIDPFIVPEHWRIYRGFDFGYAKPFSVGWFAVDTEGRMYRIKELYGCTSQNNVGVKWTVQEIAQGIKDIEESDPNLKGKMIRGIADPSIWEESKGESIAAMMERPPYRVYFEKGDNKRLPGKMQCHYRLAFDADGKPMFYTFSSCKEFIRCIPSLVYSETKIEDVDTDGEDHNYDEWRYVMMENPIPPRMNKAARRTPPAEDPLDIYKDSQDIQYERYNFMRI